MLAVFALLLLCSAAKKVSVIGANGRAGRLVVDVAAQKGYDVVAYTRSGQLDSPVDSKLSKRVTCKALDVTRPETLTGLEGDAVIFCASASKEGGTPTQVDKQGLVNVGEACIKKSIARLVVVSSGAVTKPFSPVFLFLNLFGGIMKAKAVGEDTIRTLYSAAPLKLGYTIVRPGGLTLEPPLGPSGLELNQKDEKSGRISRYDVAAICVESIDAPSASRVTLECYNKDTGKPLSSVFFSNMFKMSNKDEKPAGIYERRGNSWKDLFSGLVTDSKLD
jgi:uncharacterized protein YbjT (DUF2867 family)